MKSKKGFTLVEVMIAIGLMAAGGLALMKTNEIAVKTNTTAQVGISWQLKRFQIQDSLITTLGCEHTLKGKTFGAIPSIKSKTGSFDIAKVGANYPENNPDFTISAITFIDLNKDPDFNYGIISPTELAVTVLWTKDSAGKAKNTTSVYRFEVEATIEKATKLVTGCRGTDANFVAADACDLFGGDLIDTTGAGDNRCINIDGYQGTQSVLIPTNVSLGRQSLTNNTAGEHNTALGELTLSLSSANNDNTAVGYSAGANSNASQNTYIGSYAGLSNVTSIQNTAIGFRAMGSVPAAAGGNYNTAIGADTLYSDSTGSWNIAIGPSALGSNTTGDSNIAIGTNALISNLTGSWNTSIGIDSLAKGKTQSQNTAIGTSALQNNQANGNTAVGYQSLMDNQSGEGNLAIGAGSLKNNTTGNNNSAGGTNAAANNSTGHRNTTWGYQALASNSNADDNVAIGADALYSTTSGQNTAVGSSILPAHLYGSQNTALGYGIMTKATSSAGNVVIGANAMRESASAGESNIFIGHESGYYASGDTLLYNVVVGKAAGQRLTGPWNTFIGEQAGANATSAETNTLIGAHAGLNLTTGKFNVALGANSLELESADAVTGSYNVCIGDYSCRYMPPATNNYLEIKTGPAAVNSIMTSTRIADTNEIYLNGNVTINGTLKNPSGAIGVYTPFSDQRLKNSIHPYRSGLSDIMKLKVKKYRWNKSDLLDFKNKKYQTENIGVIAQELQQIMPDLVHGNGKEMLSIDVNQIFFAGIKAIQEQQQQIAENKTKLEMIEKGIEDKVEKQEQEILNLKRELASLKEIVQKLNSKR